MIFDLENYISVHERIEKFYAAFPNGRITTDIIRLEGDLVVVKASVFREKEDSEPSGTGHAYELKNEGYVNKTSHIENCETGAVGRALAFLGFEVTRGIASREEMQKAQRMGAGGDTPSPPRPQQQQQQQQQQQTSGGISDKQSKAIWAIANRKGVDETEFISNLFPQTIKGELTNKQASEVIEALDAL